jgi:purine-binding chemotaxis protein CheW
MAKKHEDLLDLQEDTQKGKFLTFSLGQEAYGIEIRYVTEIFGIQPITVVPEVPGYVKGIINAWQIIPVTMSGANSEKTGALQRPDLHIVIDIQGHTSRMIVTMWLKSQSSLIKHVRPQTSRPASISYIMASASGQDVQIAPGLRTPPHDEEVSTLKLSANCSEEHTVELV